MGTEQRFLVSARDNAAGDQPGLVLENDGSISLIHPSGRRGRLGPSVFDVQTYGAVGDGVTDDSPAILEATRDAYDAGAGRVFFPQTEAGVYLVENEIYIPNNGDPNSPTTVPITFCGPVPVGGSHGDSGLPTDVFGVTLDLRATGGGKIVSHGRGTLGLRNLVLTQMGSATDTTPLVLVTGTTLVAQDCWFKGYPTLTGYTCAQDAIHLGGTSTVPGNTDNSKFRGYGTVIERCAFNRIKQAMVGGPACNGTAFTFNFVDGDCGDSAGSAILLSGVSSKHAEANVVFGNTIEVSQYKYGAVTFNYAYHNFVTHNGLYDPTPNTTSYFRNINDSKFNVCEPNYYTSNSFEKLSGAGTLVLGFLGSFAGAPMSASDAGVGSSYYDTALKKPAWSDGSAWRDATGTAI